MARILVADDDASLRTLVVKTLAGEGHDIVAVSDGLEAAEQLRASSFDLVVSDLDMPGLDGMGLTAKVLSSGAARRILLMSAHSDELERAQGFPPDRVATLHKPFKLEALRARVRDLLLG